MCYMETLIICFNFNNTVGIPEHLEEEFPEADWQHFFLS